MTVVYTDGACSGNPGPGGWAWAVIAGPYASGFETQTTNQRMELTAVLEALRFLDGPVEIVSDSTYVVNCFRDEWWVGWKKRGWKNSKRQPVANRDLWEPLIDLVNERGDVTFTWVKGHSGDAGNDLADGLAVSAIVRRGPDAGPDSSQAEILATDVPGERPVAPASSAPATSGTPATAVTATRSNPAIGHQAAGAVVPGGRKLLLAGLRPPGLGGYDDHDTHAAVRRHLAKVIDAKASMYPDLVVLTGLGLGAEQLGASAAADVGVPYVAVLAHPAFDRPWPDSSKAAFARLCDGAEAVVQLEKKAPATKDEAGQALSRRDAWLARTADEAVVVHDGRDRLVESLVRSLEDHLGEDVWVIDPSDVI